jgi:anti-sigma factor ChrR (cupin superfamily)
VRHQRPTDEVVELAALYAVGALDPEEAVAFESHLAEGCQTCEAEVRTFSAVSQQLGYATTAETPRADVRRRLFARVQTVPVDWTIIRSSEGQWEPSGVEGVFIKRLFHDQDRRRITALGRINPRIRYPSHRHADIEELYVLEGDFTVEGQVLCTGDYSAARSGTVHGETYSESGCTFLLHASEEDQVIDERPEVPQTGLLFVRAAEGEWKPGPDAGVTRRTLFVDRARGTATVLVRMEPGAQFRPHRHLSAEQVYMLEGDGHVTGQVLHAGDYYRLPAGTEHEVTYTEGGCLFLVVSSQVEILE